MKRAILLSGLLLALDISERQMRRYCSGEHDVPRVVEYALRWLIHCGDDAELLTRGRP